MDIALLLTVAMQNVVAIPTEPVGASPSLASQVTSAEGARPNFVFILLDDWGTGDVGAYQTLTNHGIDQVICCHVFIEIHDKNRVGKHVCICACLGVVIISLFIPPMCAQHVSRNSTLYVARDAKYRPTSSRRYPVH